jgi:hypothetical protein
MGPADPLGLSSNLFPPVLWALSWYLGTVRAMPKYVEGQGFETGKDLVGWSLIDGQVPGLMIQGCATGVRAAQFSNGTSPPISPTTLKIKARNYSP